MCAGIKNRIRWSMCVLVFTFMFYVIFYTGHKCRPTLNLSLWLQMLLDVASPQPWENQPSAPGYAEDIKLVYDQTTGGSKEEAWATRGSGRTLSKADALQGRDMIINVTFNDRVTFTFPFHSLSYKPKVCVGRTWSLRYHSRLRTTSREIWIEIKRILFAESTLRFDRFERPGWGNKYTGVQFHVYKSKLPYRGGWNYPLLGWYCLE